MGFGLKDMGRCGWCLEELFSLIVMETSVARNEGDAEKGSRHYSREVRKGRPFFLRGKYNFEELAMAQLLNSVLHQCVSQ